MPTMQEIDNLETLLGNGSFGPLVKLVCKAARRGVEEDAEVRRVESALSSDIRNLTEKVIPNIRERAEKAEADKQAAHDGWNNALIASANSERYLNNQIDELKAELGVLRDALEQEKNRAEQLEAALAGVVWRENAKQAKIDALMLEYCPDEMTPEQIAEWEAHQKPSPDQGEHDEH